jgi:hypothetical protein
MTRIKHSGAVRLSVTFLVLACGLALGVSIAAADGGPTTTTTADKSGPSSSALVSQASAIGSGFTEVTGIQYFVVPGTGSVAAHFDYAYREAICSGSLEVFKVDSTDGAINGVLPGSSGWPTAVSLSSPQMVFSSSTRPGASADLTFQGGEILAFRFHGCSQYFYSYDAANPNSEDNVLTYQNQSTGQWQMGWEDNSSGSGDYNDMVVNVTGLKGGGSVTPPPPTDTTPPTVSISADPVVTSDQGDLVTGTVQLTAVAADNVGVAGVQFQLDGVNLGSAVTAEIYNFNWDTTAVADGPHTLTAVASDAAGNTATSVPLTVIVLNNLAANGEGNDGTSDTTTADLTTKSECGSTAVSGTNASATQDASSVCKETQGWCASKNEAVATIQTVDSKKPIEYHNRFTHLTYWRASAKVLACVNANKGIVVDFKEKSATVTPLYSLSPIWHYDNNPHWSYGLTGSKAPTSYAQVTDSFTGCPFILPVGCNTVTFTVYFEVNSDGTYRYSLRY